MSCFLAIFFTGKKILPEKNFSSRKILDRKSRKTMLHSCGGVEERLFYLFFTVTIVFRRHTA
jgi:hypothetical protein